MYACVYHVGYTVHIHTCAMNRLTRSSLARKALGSRQMLFVTIDQQSERHLGCDVCYVNDTSCMCDTVRYVSYVIHAVYV